MVWPSLISLAEAPGPYLACAEALPAGSRALSASDAASQNDFGNLTDLILLPFESSHLHIATRQRDAQLWRKAPAQQPDEASHSRGHEVHEANQENAID